MKISVSSIKSSLVFVLVESGQLAALFFSPQTTPEDTVNECINMQKNKICFHCSFLVELNLFQSMAKRVKFLQIRLKLLFDICLNRFISLNYNLKRALHVPVFK